MLKAVEVFKIFINDLNGLVREGPENRRRVLELGGADMLVAATAFLKDEFLLESCVDAIRLLCSETEIRRYILKDRIDCAAALASVLSKPHRAIVIEHTIEALALLCCEHQVTARMVELGVLNAIIKLCSTVGPKNVVVLRSCASMAKRMSRDSIVSCQVLLVLRAFTVCGTLCCGNSYQCRS